ncbi:MAG: metallophosphoesterase [Leptospiraceae bacterium]|nr:metallophosphoesterase [Leptospiraceae bacterium]MCP5498936.1 metallophosphoesterase [Leptospiraceae bacterium]
MKFAIIGDIHGYWNSQDLRYFNDSDYDFLLFTGDLPTYFSGPSLIPKRLSGLKKKAYLIPGNHDSSNLFQLTGELFQNKFLIQKGFLGQEKRLAKFKKDIAPVELCYYTYRQEEDYALLFCRPFSMGGPFLSFQPFLSKYCSVNDFEDSIALLASIVDEIEEEKLLVISHNGPTGLGDRREDIWGKDFDPRGGDWGDKDLEELISYCKKKKKRVELVLAGHMHYSETKRTNFIEKDSTLYLNSARVPRIFKKGKQMVHRHIRVEFVEAGPEISTVDVYQNEEQVEKLKPLLIS